MATMGKYTPLQTYLEGQPADRESLSMSFSHIAELVEGLPPSAYTLPNWWANNSHPQALAWREAGWHVDSVAVHTERGRVTFARGRVGGTLHDRTHGHDS